MQNKKNLNMPQVRFLFFSFCLNEGNSSMALGYYYLGLCKYTIFQSKKIINNEILKRTVILQNKSTRLTKKTNLQQPPAVEMWQ